MRDIFEEIFVQGPIDPVEAVRRSTRVQLRRRFYKSAHVDEDDGGFAIRLDGRAVRTPARRILAGPDARARGRARRRMERAGRADRSAEHAAHAARQLDHRRRGRCACRGGGRDREISRLRSRGLSRAGARRPGRAAGAGLGSDRRLGARDARAPASCWPRGSLSWPQPAAALAAARAAIPHDPWRLGALNAITTLTGSALIALAVLAGRLSARGGLGGRACGRGLEHGILGAGRAGARASRASTSPR